MTLNNNAANPTIVATNGSFSFSTPVTYRSNYAVTVGTQPVGETCTVNNSSGTMAASNVSNVTVSCATNGYAIGGTVSGLAAHAQVTLFDNNGDALVVSANGSFNFATMIVPNGSYAVTVNQQPAGQYCTVAGGTGNATANVSNVNISCTTDLSGITINVIYQSLAEQGLSVTLGGVTTTNDGNHGTIVYSSDNNYQVDFYSTGNYDFYINSMNVSQNIVVSPLSGSTSGCTADIPISNNGSSLTITYGNLQSNGNFNITCP